MEKALENRTIVLPRYHQLPDIGLYMDQVIALTDRSLAPLFGENSAVLTASMVNNYVKQRLLQPPVKKRYSREHVARLIVVCMLKQVLSIPETTVLLSELFDGGDFSAKYDAWCDMQERAFSELALSGRSLASLAAISVAGKSLVQKNIR